MLTPEWASMVGAFIEKSLLEYSAYAVRARRLGSELVTDSFLKNVMIQKLDHRWGLYSFWLASCHGAVWLCRNARARDDS